jgi:hypothetical protein
VDSKKWGIVGIIAARYNGATMTRNGAPMNRARSDLFVRVAASAQKYQQIFVTSIVTRQGFYLVKRICFQHFCQ